MSPTVRSLILLGILALISLILGYVKQSGLDHIIKYIRAEGRLFYLLIAYKL